MIHKYRNLLVLGFALLGVYCVYTMLLKNKVNEFLGISSFYPVVSRELAMQRDIEKKHLGVLESDHADVYRKMAEFD